MYYYYLTTHIRTHRNANSFPQVRLLTILQPRDTTEEDMLINKYLYTLYLLCNVILRNTCTSFIDDYTIIINK